jgi:SNF2 family DNA or RNA helicase
VPTEGPRVVIVSYNALSSTASTLLRGSVLRQGWDLLVLDEAHMLGRNSERTRFILGPVNGLHRKAHRVLPLSGTPATKSASELYPIIRALWPFLVEGMRWRDFEDAYCRVKTMRIGFREVRTVVGTNQTKIADLRNMLSPYMQVLKTDDVLTEIPPLRVQTYPVSVQTNTGRGLTKEMLDANEALDKLLDGAEDIEETLRENQTHFATARRLIGLLKTDIVVEIAADELEANGNKKLVIFAWHREVIEGICKGLDSYGVVRVDGSVSVADKQYAQDKFQTDPKCRVFVGQLCAAGTNLTLTASHDVLLAEASWTPGENYQAIRRCRRIGQTKPVLARYIALDGADDRIMRVLAERSAELDELFETEGRAA